LADKLNLKIGCSLLIGFPVKSRDTG